jgi:hypothetical protein
MMSYSAGQGTGTTGPRVPSPGEMLRRLQTSVRSWNRLSGVHATVLVAQRHLRTLWVGPRPRGRSRAHIRPTGAGGQPNA